MGFVNYRLYNELNMTYPPNLEKDAFKLDSGLTDNDKVANNNNNEDNEDNNDLDEFNTADNKDDDKTESGAAVTLKQIQEASSEVHSLQKLFKNHVFFLSRETPRYALEFMIRSCGGEVSWDSIVGGNPPFPESDERITIQVCDRPKVNNRVLSRTYVQPQWVADSLNARKLIKTSLYAPGELLPPHLSPFVEAKEGDYVPTTGIESESEEEQEEKEAGNAEEQEEVNDEDEYERDLKAESDGITFSESNTDNKKGGDHTGKTEMKKKKRTEAEAEEEDQKEMATVMMSKKKRKLYNRMQASNQKKADAVEKLQRKKKALESKK